MSCSEHGTTLAFPLGGRCHEVTEEGRSPSAIPSEGMQRRSPYPLSSRPSEASGGILYRTESCSEHGKKEFVFGALARKTHSTARLTLLLAAPLRVTKWGHLKRVSPLPFPLLFLSFPFSCSVLPFLLRGVCIFLISDRCCPSAAARAPSLFCRSVFFLLFFLLFPFLPFFPLLLFPSIPLSRFFSLLPFFPSPAALFHVLLNCSARLFDLQVINNMWATAPRNLYIAGHKPPKYRKFRQSYQHFIVEILIFVEKCVTIDV